MTILWLSRITTPMLQLFSVAKVALSKLILSNRKRKDSKRRKAEIGEAPKRDVVPKTHDTCLRKPKRGGGDCTLIELGELYCVGSRSTKQS